MGIKGYNANIEEDTVQNENFRKVVYTSKHSQVVLMSLLPNQEIGVENHKKNDQFFRFEKGEGQCVIDGHEYQIKKGSAVLVPAGCKHNITNTSQEDLLQFYTIYSPPHHKDGIIHKTKEEAEKSDEKFDGQTTE